MSPMTMTMGTRTADAEGSAGQVKITMQGLDGEPYSIVIWANPQGANPITLQPITGNLDSGGNGSVTYTLANGNFLAEVTFQTSGAVVNVIFSVP